MANSPQARYRSERAERVRDRRSKQMSALRTSIKKIRKAAETSSSKDTLTTLLRGASTMLDKASNKGLIHANKAARLKSRLNSLVKLS